ncbi:unnamed protein product [Brassica oleracea]|uniref:(rape) hypothetical protein n=1 Tax=Brassica napus TaxID=3708 RepID=A0A816JBD1_BRANA|nr:unnamed protein product [Brassica napus]
MYPSRVRYLSCWVARVSEVSQFHSDVSLRYLVGKELLIRKTLSLNGPLRYGQRESVTCNLIDSKQSDVVSSVNSHHLIIVVSSLDSHHLNQRRDPNGLTISSLAALTPHHLISSRRRHSSSSLLQRANQRRDPNHLISSHHGHNQISKHTIL